MKRVLEKLLIIVLNFGIWYLLLECVIIGML